MAGPCLEVVGTVTRQRHRQTDRRRRSCKQRPPSEIPSASSRPRPTPTAVTGSPAFPPKNSFGQTDDVLASVPDGPPYLQSVQSLDEKLGAKPVTQGLRAQARCLARGRVTDKATGKPIRANLDYFILDDNPHLKDYPRYGTIRAGMPYPCDENGYFKIVVMPGRGILGARFGNDTYRLGVGIEKIKGLN